MGFTADEVVDELHYDFKPFVPALDKDGHPVKMDGEVVYVSGVTPEPSDDQVKAYKKFLSDTMLEAISGATDGSDGNRVQRRAAAKKTTAAKPAKATASKRVSQAELAKQLSQEEVAALPPILQQAYVAANYLAWDDGPKVEAGLQAMAELCSGTPSVEDLRRCPFRVRKAFMAHMTAVVLGEDMRTAINF